MNIRFIYKGEPRELEAYVLLDKLHKAPIVYTCATGRTPTHLVLGDTEWAQFHAYVQAMNALGMTRELHQTPGLVEGPTPKFNGLTLLRSAEDSLALAVEQQEVRRG